MPRSVLFIRPEPGLSQTAAKARAKGLRVEIFPLFEIKPVEWELHDALEFDALLIGSANALRHGGPKLDKLCHLPVHAVGQSTAEFARGAGFEVASVGTGGLQSVLNELPRKGMRLLRLSGEERISLSHAYEHEIHDLIIYRAQPVTLPMSFGPLFKTRPVVAVHSAAAARHFTNECNRLNIDRAQIDLAVLGRRIAEAAGEGWAGISIAPAPNDATLLAMIENMCQ